MNYEDLVFEIASAISPACLLIMIIGIIFDFLRGLVFTNGRWN